MKRLLASTAIYGLGAMASRLVTLLLLPVFTAHLVPADYGVVAMLTVVGGFVAPIFTLGLGSSIGSSTLIPRTLPSVGPSCGAQVHYSWRVGYCSHCVVGSYATLSAA